MPKKTQLLPTVGNTGTKASGARSKSNNNKKQANRILAWVMGFVVDVLPVVVCKIQATLYSSSSNTAKAALYENFLKDFVSSGSFMWTSMTVLIMSLIELLFSGFNRKSSSSKKWWGKIIVVSATAGILLFAVVVYFSNIVEPYSSSVMEIISWVSFALLIILSGVISFIFV